ncbi:SubName: Full=Uncharacterized protein {ECO:0000313/EMBL:CCA67964.1} [Serendipita indica DSM 11827]|nr:SubName: Full=Uncharacterized protein {ECO:0000313/EMBL:CCA67964.1} [Serendipita indica DSM 11827]
MLVFSLLFSSLAPLAVLAGTPSAVRSLSGKDYSYLLKRSDGPSPFAFSYPHKRAPVAVPPTLLYPGGVERHWVATQVLSNARIEIIAVRMVQSVAPQTLCAARVVVAVEMDAAVAEILVLSSTVLAFVARLANSAMVRLDALKMARFNVQERHSAAVTAGETCGRNAAGEATCNGQTASGNSVTISANNATPVDTEVSVPTSGASSSSATGSNSSSSSTRSSSISTTARTTTTVAPTTSATSSTGGALKTIPAAAGVISLGALALFIVA